MLMRQGTVLAVAAWAAGCLCAAGSDGGSMRREAFADAAALTAWDLDGRWAVRDGALACRSERIARAVWYRAPIAGSLHVEATLTVEGRAAPGAWVAAGLCAWHNGGNYWRLALVESPTGNRYAELVEMRDAEWQAQISDRLEATHDGGPGLQWKDNRPYRLALTLGPEGVEGTIRDAASGEVAARLGYRFGRRPAVRRGRLALHQTGVSARWDDVVAEATVAAAAAKVPVRRGPAGAAAIVDTLPLGEQAKQRDAAARIWEGLLEEAGLGVNWLSPEAAAAPGVLSPERYDLCVVPDVAPRPQGLAEAFEEYLLEGGRAVACGGPAFTRQLWKAGGAWLDRDRYAAAIQNAATTRLLADFEAADALEAWTCGGSNAGSTPKASADGPLEGHGRVLRLDFENYTGWGHAARTWEKPFPAEHSLTVLWAHAPPGTSEMIVEWKERDESRWIATVPLTPRWRRIVLAPDDFVFWRDSRSTGRGGQGDRLRPQNAVYLSFGIAESHCAQVAHGRHTVWIDGVATAVSPVEQPPDFPARPCIELFCPPYKTYRMRDAVRLAAAPGSGLDDLGELRPPAGATSPVARCAGRGLGHGTRLRWIPLLDALDAQGRNRGTLLSLLAHWRPPFYGAAWAYLGTADAAFLAREPVRRALGTAIGRMMRGVFIVQGGTREFAWRRGESVAAGARVANLGKRPFKGTLALELTAPSGKAVWEERLEVSLEPGQTRLLTRERRLAPADGLFRARVRLLEGEREIDRVDHTWQFEPERPADDFVSVRDGDFWLAGKRWFPVGVNYWPRLCAGLESHEYVAHWLDPAYYDPDVVDEELARLAALGATVVNVQAHEGDEERTLADFLLRCRRHGLRVFLFVGGLDPLEGGPDRGLRLIERFGLAADPTVFAYDIAWEPRFFGRRASRSWARFDAAWRQWIAGQYGSVAAAEKAWGCPAPRENAQVATPSFVAFRGKGAASARMIAAFHRFFYDHAGERYARVIRRIRAAAPRQLIGFRGQASTPPSSRGLWPMHAPGALKATDFVSPEGYGLLTRGGSRRTPTADIRRGGLTTLALRAASGGKPVFWSEYGACLYVNGTRWTDALLDLPPERFAYQVDELTDWARMLAESGANGATPWWSCGGHRTNEGSDWGLFHPDGTPRPCCAALEQTARTIPTPRRKPDAWIEFDLDAHVFDAWPHYSGRYLALLEDGRVPGLRLAGHGTDSTTCPDLAVGNAPWGGAGPAKYLNAMFEVARCEGGKLTVVATNTGVAAWADGKSAGGRPGAVELVIRAGAKERVVPIPRAVPMLGEAAIGPIQFGEIPKGVRQLRLRMRARGRGEFGLVARVVPAANPKHETRNPN